jgi:hypothetical protein
MSKRIQGFLAWMGCWAAMVAIAAYVIELRGITDLMTFGALTFIVAEKVSHWIRKPTPRDAMTTPKEASVNVGTPGHIDHIKAGLTPRGFPMPHTMAEWQHMAHLYAEKILEDKETISKLKKRNNVLQQKVAALRDKGGEA